MALDKTLAESMALPAVCAPMTLVSGPDLVIAARGCGLMAGLPRHNARSHEEFSAWLVTIDDALARRRDEGARIGPLAVNLATALPPDELKQELDLCRRHGVEIIISARGDPTELAARVHDWGGHIFHDVTTMRFVEKAMRAGVDGLNCIAAGGGGHSGLLSAFAFVPKVRQIFDGTILLGGGISTGEGIRAAQVLGADLAYLGTRFIATQEAAAAAAYKAMLIESAAADLVYTADVAGTPANWLAQSLVAIGLDPANLPRSKGWRNYDHLPAGARPWRDIWSAGQGIEMIDDLPPVQALVSRLTDEYRAACNATILERN